MSKRHRRYRAKTAPIDLREQHRAPADEDAPDVVDRLCPGRSCNREYLKASSAAARELQAAHDENRDEDPKIVNHGVKPTGGQPIWCNACRDRILQALGRLPDLAAAVHVTGPQAPHILHRVIDRGAAPRLAEAETVPTVVGDAVRDIEQPDWWWDQLDCGHTIHYPAPSTVREVRTLPTIRRCGACLTGAGRDTGSSQIGAGRIAATSGESDATRHGTRTGSPSGSPALDMVDYVAAWAGDWVDELAAHLGHATRSHRGVRARITHLSGHVDYLTTHATALLCADGIAERVGREALSLAARLEKAAGADRVVHRLPAPCPDCDRLTLARDDGSEQVDCRACGARWPWADYQRLTMVLADEQRRREAGA